MKRIYDQSTGEGSGFVVYEEFGKLYLYSIPMYGGFESYECDVESIEEAIAIAKTWT